MVVIELGEDMWIIDNKLVAASEDLEKAVKAAEEVLRRQKEKVKGLRVLLALLELAGL